MDDQNLNTLLEQLRALWSGLQRGMMQKWKRTLPMADYIIDRWEKARVLGFGEGTSIYDSSLVLGNVTVGKNTWIGPFTVLDGSGGLQIGDNCSISAGVQIYSHDTVDWAISGGKVGGTKDPVTVGSNCYIGPNAILAKGVSVGDGCIIGANSLVLTDIPPDSKAYGTPCRIYGSVRNSIDN